MGWRLIGKPKTQQVTKSLARQIYVKCVQAWNAWRKNEPTELKYYASAKIPAIV